MQTLSQWRAFAKQMKQKIVVAGLLLRKPGVPWATKAILMLVVAYVLSPVDLVPDFIPILGMLDDLVIVPALIWLAFRWVPASVLAEAEAEAAHRMATLRWAAAWGMTLILGIWLALGYWAYLAWFAPGP